MGRVLLVAGNSFKPSSIATEIQGSALVIRFVRPEIRNPLSIAVLHQLDSIINLISDEVDRIVFTGVDDVFASGADLREVAGASVDEAPEFALRGQRLMARIAEMPHLTIAAVNGYCFGGALDLALACTMRIASPNAQFAHPGAGLGIITGWGGTQRLPRLVGTANALEMFFSAAPVSASWAHRIGLVDQLADDVVAAAMALPGASVVT